MRAIAVAGTLFFVICVIASSSAFAQYRRGILLTHSQARAYHACLYEAWIQDWCQGHAAWPTATYERVYAGCVVANRGGRIPLAGRTYANTDDYCWTVAHYVR
jgi:hypothetical protein